MKQGNWNWNSSVACFFPPKVSGFWSLSGLLHIRRYLLLILVDIKRKAGTRFKTNRGLEGKDIAPRPMTITVPGLDYFPTFVYWFTVADLHHFFLKVSLLFFPSAIFVHCTIPPNPFLSLLQAGSTCSATVVFSGFSTIQVYTDRQIHILEKTNTKHFVASSLGADDGEICGDCHDSLKSGPWELCPLYRQILSQGKWSNKGSTAALQLDLYPKPLSFAGHWKPVRM